MTFLFRARLALVAWWLRKCNERTYAPAFRDLEGMGRSLARPPLGCAGDAAPTVPASLAPTASPRRTGDVTPMRLVARTDH